MPKLISRLLRLIAGSALFGLTLFGTAGRIDWPGAWTLLIFFFLFLLFVLVWQKAIEPRMNANRRELGRETGPQSVDMLQAA
jgi:hypothetical protein